MTATRRATFCRVGHGYENGITKKSGKRIKEKEITKERTSLKETSKKERYKGISEPLDVPHDVKLLLKIRKEWIPEMPLRYKDGWPTYAVPS